MINLGLKRFLDCKQLFIFFVFLCLILQAKFSFANGGISIVKDVEIEDYIRNISDNILTNAGISPDSVNFYLVEDKSINAFVALGQNIFVHTGLISMAENSNEFASVIAHEIGHIAGGHLILGEQFREKTQALVFAGLASGIIAGLASGGALLGLTEALTIGSINSSINLEIFFTRNQEREADKLGVIYMEKSNYDPTGFLTFLEKLYNVDPTKYLSKSVSIFLDHPLTIERMNFAKYYLDSIKDKENRYVDMSLYDYKLKLIQAKIDAYNLGLQNIKIKYNKNTNVDKYANAISNLMADNLDKALSIFISIDNYQQNPYVLELIGDLYQKKRKFEKAIEYYKSAIKIYTKYSQHDTQNNIYMFYVKISQAYFNANKIEYLEESLKYINIALSINKNLPSVWYIKSLVLAKMGKIPESQLAMAEKFLTSFDTNNAIIFANKALEGLNKNSQEWIQAKDIINLAKRR
jgi:predicted Zn-dependent protease